MSDGLAVPPSATTAPMATSAALRQYSEMLSDIEGRVDEGVYLQVCNAGMDLHKAKEADLLRAWPTLGDEHELVSPPPSDDESEDETLEAARGGEGSDIRRNLRTVRMVHSALRSTVEENDRLRTANDVHQAQLCAVLERVDALEQRVQRERRHRIFHKKCCRALEGIVRREGVAAHVLDEAYAAHDVLDQVCVRERKRKCVDESEDDEP